MFVATDCGTKDLLYMVSLCFFEKYICPPFSASLGGKGSFLFRGAALLLLAGVLFGCSSKEGSYFPERSAYTPTSMNETPERFLASSSRRDQEIKSWTELAPYVRSCLAYAQEKPAGAVAFRESGQKVSWREIAASLEELLNLLPQLDSNPNLLRDRFRWMPVSGGMHYTSYYEICMAVKKEKSPGFTCPIYARPPELDSYKASHRGKFFTRAQINRGALAGRGLEIAWGDPLDVYCLQIEGSGRLVFEDGTDVRVNVDGVNGYSFENARFKGRDHWEEIRERERRLNTFGENVRPYPPGLVDAMNSDKSYVFFNTSEKQARGAVGFLKGWVSLAVDPSFIPLGSIVAYALNAPDFRSNSGQNIAIRGIGLAQDTGGAIKNHHIDIYSGGDSCAMYYGNFLSVRGPAWVLVRR